MQYLVVARDYPNGDFQTVVLPKVDRLVRAGTFRPLCRAGAVTAYIRKERVGS